MTAIKNNVTWITGASSGIGEELAYQMAQKGGKLILSARRESELQRVQAAIQEKWGTPVEILPLDLLDNAALPEKAKQAEAFFGRIDVLINNGGISQRGLVNETIIEVDRKVFETNYFGSITLTKAVLPGMLERKFGHHVAISSTTGYIGTPLRSAYAASKHALHGFYDSMRAETYQDNVHVTIICPGFINTPITYSALKADGSKLNQMGDAQQKGLPVQVCAAKTIRAIERNKNEAHISGPKEHLAILVMRFFPRLFAKMIRNIKST